MNSVQASSCQTTFIASCDRLRRQISHWKISSEVANLSAQEGSTNCSINPESYGKMKAMIESFVIPSIYGIACNTSEKTRGELDDRTTPVACG
jgi:hypothetical protein